MKGGGGNKVFDRGVQSGRGLPREKMRECGEMNDMPARKPVSLLVSDRHKTRMAEREKTEAALALEKKLSIRPPVELTGYPIAQGCWKYLIGLYSRLEGVIVTPFDKDILIEYCLGMEYVTELRNLRRIALTSKNYELYIAVDTRVDRKGARLDTLRAQLYLTPRSRAGVAPVEKDPDEVEPPIPEGGYDMQYYLKTGKWKEEE